MANENGNDIVRTVQQILKEAGYYSGPIDGERSSVAAAVRTFQGAKGLQPTGSIDATTRAYIVRLGDRQKDKLKPQDVNDVGEKTAFVYSLIENASTLRMGWTVHHQLAIVEDLSNHVRLDVKDRLRLRQGSTHGAGMWLNQEKTSGDEAFIGMARDNQVGFWGQSLKAWGLVMDTSTGNVGIGHQDPGVNASNGNIRLDVMDRVRIRQGGTGGAGIWLHQRNTNKDEAFVGMKSDGEVGFWGVKLNDWGCWMDLRGSWYAKSVFSSGVLSADGAVFASDVNVKGGDCAEWFEAVDQVDPGTVMVLSEAGHLVESAEPYDRRVAGVVSGAGDLKPGLMLGSQAAAAETLPIALCGKVFCKVEADSNPIEVGDLLTTADVPGHAMKAADPARAFGTILGKATRPLASGRGMIPVLVTLQ